MAKVLAEEDHMEEDLQEGCLFGKFLFLLDGHW